MRYTPWVLLILAGIPASLTAQVRVGARLGATWSSTLVEDMIVNPIDVKPGIAPTLVLGASLPTGRRYRIGLEGIVTTASLSAQENGAETDLGGLRTVTLLLTGEGPLMVRDVYWRVGVGFISYAPGEQEGLFQQGGPTRLTGSIAAEYRRAWRPGWDWVVGARYSLHGFNTDELKARGFSRSRLVHRVGLEAGLSRSF